METTSKRKISIPLIIVGAFLSAAIGYYVNGAWHTGIEVEEFFQNLQTELSYPLYDYYNESTIKAVIIAEIIFAIVMLLYYTSRHNLMPGKEYGTAKYATAKALCKVLKADVKTGTANRILSQNIEMNINNRLTGLNNNILVIGGSGARKTFGFVKPNLMQLNTSFFITDPKGEILRSEGAFLAKHGYRVKVLNLMDMASSDGYNPFDYIREPNDITILINNIIANTTPKDSKASDPFWENSESMFLQSLFMYVWLECKKSERNIRSVLSLLRKAEIRAKDEPSELDNIMSELAQTSELGTEHPAFILYQMSMRGAADTVRSIIISANARLAKLQNDTVLRLLDHDDMHFEEFGAGDNGDENTKTALFCLIPDSDKTYNFIVGMLYTQAFQTLYRLADDEYGGELPIHVTFMLDEFANVALPDGFTNLISTMRSRSISSIIIIQNMAQIKAMFKDTWENITGNCDTCIYLGGNEQSTHEYMSKLLGKATIEKRSTGESRGRQGSASKNYDVIGRDLMTPDEVSRLDRGKCIVKVTGQYPIIDDKYDTPHHKMFAETGDGKGKKYVLTKKTGMAPEKPFELLGEKGLSYYERKAASGKHPEIQIDTLTYDEFMILDEFSYRETLTNLADSKEVARLNEQEGLSSSLRYMAETEGDDEDEGNIEGDLVKGMIHAFKKGITYEHPGNNSIPLIRSDPAEATTDGNYSDEIKERLDQYPFTPEQREEIFTAIRENIPAEYILSYAYPGVNTVKLATYRAKYKNGLVKSA